VRFRTMRPSSHGQFRIAREGKGWLAVAPGFCNLECSPFGYAMSPDAAIEHLLGGAEYQRLAAGEGWRAPGTADFVRVDVLEEQPPQTRAPAPLLPRLVFSR
jgi:hypothetical protein